MTLAPLHTAGDIVSRVVDPDTVTADTDICWPSAITVNAFAAAVVADNASFIVMVSVVPAAFNEAETNVGATMSGNE